MNNIDNIRVTEGCPRAIVLKGSIEEMGRVPPEREDAKRDMRALMYIAEKHCPKFTEWMQGLQKGCEEKGIQMDIEDLYMVATYPDERW